MGDKVGNKGQTGSDQCHFIAFVTSEVIVLSATQYSSLFYFNIDELIFYLKSVVSKAINSVVLKAIQ